MGRVLDRGSATLGTVPRDRGKRRRSWCDRYETPRAAPRVCHATRSPALGAEPSLGGARGRALAEVQPEPSNRQTGSLLSLQRV